MAPEAPSPLDEKILEHFPGLVVRKDLTTELKQNAVVPTGGESFVALLRRLDRSIAKAWEQETTIDEVNG